MKKITYLPHHYREPSGQGGLRTWHQVNELVRHFAVTVIVPGVDTLSGRRHDSLGRRQCWALEQRSETLRVFRVNSLANDRTRKWKRAAYYVSFSAMQFLCALRHGRGRAVITTSMPVSSMVLAWLLSAVQRAPLVLDVRDLPTDLALEIGYVRDSFFSRTIRWLETFVYRRADLIVTVSEGMRTLLLRKDVAAERVHVVPIGYDQLETTASAAPELPAELEGKFVVLYSGTMGHVVDVDTVLDAALATRDDPQIVYLLVGDGQRIDEYRERVRRERLNVVLTGRVEKRAIAGYCARADVCLYPLVDGEVIGALLGNKIFDYMGAERATIYSGPDGDVARLIRKAGGGVTLGARDVTGLVAAIRDLQADPDRAQAMGRDAGAYVREHLTARHAAVRLAQLIDEVTDD